MPTQTIQAATTLKTSAGIVRAVNVCVAGSTDGMVCDAASTGTASAANAVLGCSSTQARAEPIVLPINCQTGITVVPGTGQTIWINWE
jgi:hypothetical protein